MKKAKVVINQTAKQKRLITGKKAAWIVLGTVAALGAVSVVVPTSNIPGFKYIAELVGVNADATRGLTMFDFASYAVGAKDSKVQELRASNISTYGSGAGGTGGGLSPFATLSADRLAEAYAKNSQEAIEMEKSLSGEIASFDKNVSNKEFALDPALLAKGFDPAKLSDSSYAARSGAMEALAAAAGQQAEAFGKPVKKTDLQDVANLVGIGGDANISNIVGGGNIATLAKKDDLLYDRIAKNAKALMGTSVFGSVNPEFSRTDTRIGRPVYGLFKDLGTAFFFSRYASGAKLRTAASDIAVAAFDGGSPQDQSIITRDEHSAAPTSVDPEQELSSGAGQVNMCSQVSQAAKELISSTMQMISTTLLTMYNLTITEGVKTNINVPGTCRYKNASKKNKKAASARNKWNRFLNGSGNTSEMLGQTPSYDMTLEEQCEELLSARESFANVCGITFDPPQYSCSEMVSKLRLGKSNHNMGGYCRQVASFGSDVNVRKRKITEYNKLVQKFIDMGLPYGEDGGYVAEELAGSIVFSKKDLEVSGAFVCTNIYDCMNYVAEILEGSFAVENFDLRGFLKDLDYFKDNYLRLQELDVAFLKQCQKVGDMSECQGIMDYYTDDVLESQCPSELSWSPECEYLWETLRGVHTKY